MAFVSMVIILMVYLVTTEKSPHMNYDYVAYYVRSDGGIDDILNINVDGSYGI